MAKDKNYVLIMKARKLTDNQLCDFALQSRKAVKRIAPERRGVLGIEERGKRK